MRSRQSRVSGKVGDMSERIIILEVGDIVKTGDLEYWNGEWIERQETEGRTIFCQYKGQFQRMVNE
jgi:hypothetical protein